MVLVTPEGKELCFVVRFTFKTANSEAEYEIVPTGLRKAKELQV